MPEFIYRDEDHTYWLGSRILPGVTGVLDANGFISQFAKQHEARLRGMYAHKACELLFWEDLDWGTVHPEILGYVLSCHEFIQHAKFKPKRTEFHAYHPQLLYAGTWDVDDGEVLIDLKTGAKEDWHKFQTAGYLELARANGIPIRRRASLYLQKDGSMAKLDPHNDRADWSIFLSALNVARARPAA